MAGYVCWCCKFDDIISSSTAWNCVGWLAGALALAGFGVLVKSQLLPQWESIFILGGPSGHTTLNGWWYYFGRKGVDSVKEPPRMAWKKEKGGRVPG